MSKGTKQIRMGRVIKALDTAETFRQSYLKMIDTLNQEYKETVEKFGENDLLSMMAKGRISHMEGIISGIEMTIEILNKEINNEE